MKKQKKENKFVDLVAECEQYVWYGNFQCYFNPPRVTDTYPAVTCTSLKQILTSGSEFVASEPDNFTVVRASSDVNADSIMTVCPWYVRVSVGRNLIAVPDAQDPTKARLIQLPKHAMLMVTNKSKVMYKMPQSSQDIMHYDMPATDLFVICASRAADRVLPPSTPLTEEDLMDPHVTPYAVTKGSDLTILYIIKDGLIYNKQGEAVGSFVDATSHDSELSVVAIEEACKSLVGSDTNQDEDESSSDSTNQADLSEAINAFTALGARVVANNQRLRAVIDVVRKIH